MSSLDKRSAIARLRALEAREGGSGEPITGADVMTTVRLGPDRTETYSVNDMFFVILDQAVGTTLEAQNSLEGRLRGEYQEAIDALTDRVDALEAQVTALESASGE